MPWRKSPANRTSAANSATEGASMPTTANPSGSKRHSGTYQAAIADFEEDYGTIFGKTNMVNKARIRRASIDNLVDKFGNPIRRPSVDGAMPGGITNASGTANAAGMTTTAGTATAAGMTNPSGMSSASGMATGPGMATATDQHQMVENPAMPASHSTTTDMPSVQNFDTNIQPSVNENLGPVNENVVDLAAHNNAAVLNDEQYYTPPGSMKGLKGLGRRFRNK